MKLTLHQTHHQVADFSSIYSYLECTSFAKGLHLFPEMFLSGYPLQDIVLKSSFVSAYLELKEKVHRHFQDLAADPEVCCLIGGLEYELDEHNQVIHIWNCVFKAIPGSGMEKIYTKKLLPNYDIFDEKKYFSPGDPTQKHIFKLLDRNIAIFICEDMWGSSVHPFDPFTHLETEVKANKESLDLIINLSASPFHIDKWEARRTRAELYTHAFKAPLAYINRVGGEDEVLFDGSSFVISGNQNLGMAHAFKSDVLQVTLDDSIDYSLFHPQNKSTANMNIEEVYSLLKRDQENKCLKPWNDNECDRILKALVFGLQEYAKKTGFKKFLVALSGGIDSSLVLAMTRIAFNDENAVEAIFMPGLYTESLSFDASLELCQNLKVPLKTFPIKFLHSALRNQVKENYMQELSGLADENIQSRLRGLLLYTRSNQTNAMVINTSNKSEISVGYSTLYGDSVGALSLLGDLYKSEVFRLAEFVNQTSGGLIPDSILTRPPSAELRAEQKDSDSLPPYPQLDDILEGILSYQADIATIEKWGHPKATIKRILDLYQKSEYKRFQFCPILKVKPKSFGFGYRVPLTKNNDFYDSVRK